MIEIKNRFNGEVILTVDADSLRGANLSGANLSGAYLLGAYLLGAYLLGAALIIHGLLWYVQITKNHMRIGCEDHTIEKWKQFTDKEIKRMDKNALHFWDENKTMLLELCKKFEK